MMYWYILMVAILGLVTFLFIKVSRPAGPCLRVLMYHKVSGNGERDFLTVTADQLSTQWKYLKSEGYSPILFSDLVQFVQQGKALPPKPVLLTFDDGYKDNYEVMYPILQHLGMKANIFLVPGYLKQQMHSSDGVYLDLSEIRIMKSSLVEFGLHSYDHQSYKTLSPEALQLDIRKTADWLSAQGIPFQPCIAFPYGAYPKKNPVKYKRFTEALEKSGMVLAFRIGNRLNAMPLKKPLLVQRLDIRGDDSFEDFVRLVKKGKAVF
ncbi:polysaccharide deacetylase [Pseudobacter ginsenosidimutans]|uniref:Polysaccharide deacetylase n=2 Tax=Pseudobacter ginsenosidimutans TaxID=661488 RepID=A0A4Q7N4G1_9BACT|nr:polysaccharide deacetylase family protein [Pseudobacter ginsenosidimutans]QEC44425.1 polysaccharide deacetylase family protein [Pseudobacter ginsenosidimutans]RZS75896.1 polysaccharide deacetylase [Pseudobacter ginsenosidimutans]